MKVNIFWFRRDLRLHDNHGLMRALEGNLPVLPIFVFDKNILDDLSNTDPRVNFIHDSLKVINDQLKQKNSSLLILNNEPKLAFAELCQSYEISCIYCNHDYEPYAISRDNDIRQMFLSKGIEFRSFKDQVIVEKNEILKADGSPYTIYTPYKNKWLDRFDQNNDTQEYPSEQFLENVLKQDHDFPDLKSLGFVNSKISVPSIKKEQIKSYDQHRDIPSMESTTYVGTHLRFGTISVRRLVRYANMTNQVYLSELIWREFFMMILFHFPKVVKQSFKSKYDNIKWINNEHHFQVWCKGMTGYPMVDAGMRQLNQTGFMHNRVRMVVASFLCKHLLIDWRWGEAYFAEKLLDYELSANNGNWQWAAGTGCDAAPYFRVFNPTTQLQKFDPNLIYVKKWIPEYGTDEYPTPIVAHDFARKRALEVYKIGLGK